MRTHTRRLRIGAYVAAVCLAACTAAPAPATQGPASTAVAGTAGASPATTAEAITPSVAEAALAELQLRNWLRDAAGFTDALGPDAQAILAGSDAAEARFGEGLLAALVERYALELTAAGGAPQLVASLDRLPPADRLTAAGEWSGSLIGNTSFMVDMWMGLAPELFGQATGERFVSEDRSISETHDSTSGGTNEHLVLTENATVGLGAGRIRVDLVLTSTSTLTDSNGNLIATRTSTGKGRFEVDGCPDATGNANGHYTINNHEAVTSASGASRNGESTVDGPFVALADDGAHLIGTQFNGSISAGAQGAGSGPWSYTGEYGISVDASGSFRVGVTNAEGNATPEQLRSSSWLIAMTAHYIATAAKKAEAFWRSGACIDLKTTRESGNVKPGETIQLGVDAFAKFGDKARVSAPIQVAFTGKESLDQAGKPVDPPASLTYKAGPKEGDAGAIELTQTSRRGIGRKTVTFTVGGSDYRVAGRGQGAGWSGQKCGGLPGPWTLTFTIPGGTGTTTFTVGTDPAASVPARTVRTLEVLGTKSIFDLTGTASINETPDGTATIHLNQGSGSITLITPDGSITQPVTEPVADVIPLEQGAFCSTGG